MNALAPVPRLSDLPAPVRERLDRVAVLGRRRHEPVYLVGGMVRDALLARPSLDVDLVVEGDGPAFAGALAQELGAPCRVHRDFLTAQLDDPALGLLDVATARRERYPAPAALPRVEPATIEQDLGRRDFAVNALALRLDADGFLDPWDGLADLAGRRLRVLHERSFVDDPTRILRGVRLGARLGFRLDAATERLAREGIAAGVFDPLSGSRLAAELELLAEEEGGVLRRGLADLAGLGFFDRVLGLPNPLAPPPMDSGDRWLLLLLTLGQGRDEMALADRLQLAGERRRVLIGAGERGRRARIGLAAPDVPPHQAHQVLTALSSEELALLATEPPPVGSWARRERDEMRSLKLTIQGRDLVALGVAPGPRIGEVLDQVLRARLDGTVTARGELALAKWLLEERP
jgi:tRNA nucleotidyltransferase (CCA-adding enzyme)